MRYIVSDFRVSKDGKRNGEYLCTQLIFDPCTIKNEKEMKKWYKGKKFLITESENGVDEYEKRFNVKVKWQPITLTNGLTYRAYVIQE
jgi:hypothetical protein